MVSKKIVEAALLDGSSCSVLVLETAVLVRALSRSTPSTSWTFVSILQGFSGPLDLA